MLFYPISPRSIIAQNNHSIPTGCPLGKLYDLTAIDIPLKDDDRPAFICYYDIRFCSAAQKEEQTQWED